MDTISLIENKPEPPAHFPDKLPSKTLLGIFYMGLAMFAFTSVNALYKACDRIYPPTQVVFFRHFFSLIPYLLMLRGLGGVSLLKTTNLTVHAVRGGIAVISLACLFQGLVMLPFADAMVLSFTSTLFLTSLSQPVLGEKVDVWCWVAVALGFLGSIVMANPTGKVFNWGVAFILMTAFFDAWLMLNSRALAKTDSNVAIVFYFSLAASILSGATLPFFWITPTVKDFIFLAIVGMGGGIAQYFLTIAYRYARAATLAPIIYTSLIWSMVYGSFFFGEELSARLWIGAFLIVGAGLFIIFQENRKRNA
jgi:drug/metabolite transporter (DMT)-like permease